MARREFRTGRALALGAVTLSAIVASGVGCMAQDRFETRSLLREGGWEVELVHDGRDGDLWCEGTTTNRAGQTLDISGFQDGSLMGYVSDPDWNIAERAVTFMVDIDYARWTIDGNGADEFIFFPIAGNDDGIDFLKQLQAGTAVALMNADGRRLATFTLDGSRAAIDGLMGCWLSILAERRDEADPFVSASDPFH